MLCKHLRVPNDENLSIMEKYSIILESEPDQSFPWLTPNTKEMTVANAEGG